MAMCPGATESKFIDVATERSERLKKRFKNSARTKIKIRCQQISNC